MGARKAMEMPGTTGASAALATLTEDAPASALRIDPRLLVIDANVRGDANLTPEFLASVREHGVLVPVLVRRDLLGQAMVLDGQRRTLAAIETDQASVPFAWVEGVGDDETRVVDQIVINDHRAGLGAGDRTTAYEQLALLGRSAETIARRTGRPQSEVESALAVVASRTARMALSQHPEMPLDVAAAVAEFEDDAKTSSEIVATFERDGAGRAAHKVQQARDDRERARLEAEAAAPLIEQGYEILDANYYDRRGYDRLDRLSAKPGSASKPAPALKPDEHADCPFRAVRIVVRRPYRSGSEQPDFLVEAEHYCMSWKKAGHHNRYASASAGANAGPKDEDAKAERRQLIENNKAAESAEPVRKAFVIDLLQRKTLPKDAVVLAARLVSILGVPHEESTAWEWIGHPELRSYGDLAAKSKALASPHNATRWLLALAISASEARMPKDFWRNGDAWCAPYLEALESWGYTLSEVEQLAVKNSAKKAR